MTDEEKIKTIKRVMPAVVSIVITKHLEDIEREVPPELAHLFHGKKLKKDAIPASLIQADGMVRIGGGTGFIVDLHGLVLTNKHVVSESKAEHTVILNDGQKYPAEILCVDPINDIAILKIQSSNLPVVELGDARELELGTTVLAIGNALGLFRNTVSQGIVSGLSRSITAQADPHSPPQEMRGLVQTDAAINLGNSGGPLVTLDGRAIGINTATVSGAEGIGFAIPINAARRDLDDYKKFGEIRRPLLGIRYLTIDEEIAKKMKLPVNYGAFVIQEGSHNHAVIPKSPADKAGLQPKDIVLEANGKKITTDYSIQDFLSDMGAGDMAKLTVLRGTKMLQVEAKLTERK